MKEYTYELHAMRKTHGNGMEIGSADEQKRAKGGQLEAISFSDLYQVFTYAIKYNT
jgi:hypothetical protein